MIADLFIFPFLPPPPPICFVLVLSGVASGLMDTRQGGCNSRPRSCDDCCGEYFTFNKVNESHDISRVSTFLTVDDVPDSDGQL